MDAKTKGEYLFVIGCFSLSCLVAIALLGLWSVNTTAPIAQRAIITVLLGGLICFGALESIRWAQARHFRVKLPEPTESKDVSTTGAEVKNPSLVFVFGVPLGDNDSDTWLMLLKHYGPDTVYNCEITFIDDDRKNIEHEWLVAHPESSFLPTGMFDPSQATLRIPEAGPEGALPNFTWKPLDPNRQHYTVTISCRNGYFVEKWEVTRVNRTLRTQISLEHGAQWIEKNHDLPAVIYQCHDPEFIHADLLREIPKKHARTVNPGWKPNHRFEVPVAIIDPNENIQVVMAVQQPDGSIWSDFGCWNLLTKHIGDESSKLPSR